jgi:hypothetical protein
VEGVHARKQLGILKDEADFLPACPGQLRLIHLIHHPPAQM